MLTFLTVPVSPIPLGVARLMVGVAALVKASVFLPRLLRFSLPDVLVAPVFDWMPAPTQQTVTALAVVWLSAAVLFLVGWRVHISGPILTGALAFALFLDLQTYSNHLYLMTLLVALLTLADGSAALSLPRATPRPVPFWGCLLVMTQVSAVYLFAALTKLNSDFLSGSVVSSAMSGGVLTPPSFLTTPTARSALAVATILGELLLAVGLWFRFTRPLAVVAGIGLHAGITLFMSDTWELLAFSLLMFAAYPLFLRTLPEVMASERQGLPEPGKRQLQTGS